MIYIRAYVHAFNTLPGIKTNIPAQVTNPTNTSVRRLVVTCVHIVHDASNEPTSAVW